MTALPDAPVALADARAAIGELVELLRPACERIEIAGSVRRGKLEVKDAEVVIIPTPDLLPLTDDLVLYGRAQYALYGEKQSKRWGQNYRGLLFGGVKCELFMTTAESWGFQYWLRTGPGDANTYIMRWLSYVKAPVRFQDGYAWYSRNWQQVAKGKEMKLVWGAADRQRLAIASEEDLFAVLGLPYLAPNERTEAIYRKLTNVRDFKWPDYTPFFARDPEQMALIGQQRTGNFFDPPLDRKEEDRKVQLEAERAYNAWLHAIPVDELKARPQWALTYRG